jgi:hypothetical protein
MGGFAGGKRIRMRRLKRSKFHRCGALFDDVRLGQASKEGVWCGSSLQKTTHFYSAIHKFKITIYKTL